ncbi:hypothetical protein ILUMI_09613 [Ignelater luminosus]|uniref:Uncharacterized protein n=1 Tax=Ignelater luminosus TaxID=2038154 RepID=A0A8K0GFT5_IGNLU|nr:hypothetical protein ILUMI_09613 [Ignelater luminosus]
MNEPNVMSQVTIWKEWVKANDKKYRLIIHETSTGELFEKIKEDFIEFLHHVSSKRIQTDTFLNDKNNPFIRILQIDFAMSYSCEYQNEVQRALWARSSVTLFTAASFFNNEYDGGVIVRSAQDFANLVATLVPSTKVIYILEAEINSEIAAKKPWTDTETISDISFFIF